jgi:cellulose synthase (UDP-forming)
VKNEIVLTRIGIAVCWLALALFFRDIALAVQAGSASGIEGITIAVLITVLAYGSLVYLFARSGSLRRSLGPPPPNLNEADSLYESRAVPPHVCVLIPSYKEEVAVLRQTIVSAALAEFPSKRVVILVDDPPSNDPGECVALQHTRESVIDLDERFRAWATSLREEQRRFSERSRGDCDLHAETRRVAELYEALASWVRAIGETCRLRPAHASDHTDDFFLNSVIAASANAHADRAAQFRASLCDQQQLAKEYRRIASLLEVSITSFERKEYENLSHAPNKAMNLNSYIGLMGHCFRRVKVGLQWHLERCNAWDADIRVPEAKYLLTLDADSVVLPNYLLTLASVMERDDRVAVAQTPYSAIPGSRNRLERAAGAQTDVQYMVHQGFTSFNATFWVGANALLRLSALRDIRCQARERDHVVHVFIQDRTVIEDTGSTIDLVRRGWRLHNHHERLAYSATPPDFGSLIIQRRRWSNGGLIILPDLFRHALTRDPACRPALSELLLRAHYLCSPALVGFSILLLLLIPFDAALQSPWIAAIALPYYALYARDLRLSRYRWTELPQVYALGLMLLPVNLAGVLRSIQQLVTGRKSAFGRTPKVENRTPTPAVHLVLQLVLLAAMGAIGTRYVFGGHYYLAFFCLANFALMAGGVLLFIGPRNAAVDVFNSWKSWFVKPAPCLAAMGTQDVASTRIVREVDNGRHRIMGLDGLRAYAISLVFLVHFVAQYFNGTTGPRHVDFDAFDWTQSESVVESIAHYFWASHYGVDLFFLLSGFLIFRMISKPGFNYSRFLGNRFMRLYPAFLVALGIYCLYIAYFWNQVHGWRTVIANLLMLQGMWQLGITPIIVPTWSLTFEWLFYLTFPSILLFPSKGPRFWHLALLGAVVGIAVAHLGAHYIRFLMFLGGAALATVSSGPILHHLRRIPDVAVLTVYVLANLLFVAQQDYGRFIPVYLVTSLLLVAKTVHGNGLLHRLFNADSLRRLGKVSYSFYLFHGLVIIIVCDHVGPMLGGFPEFVRFTALLCLSFGCSAAVASLFYRLLERPYFERLHSPRSHDIGSARAAERVTE